MDINDENELNFAINVGLTLDTLTEDEIYDLDITLQFGLSYTQSKVYDKIALLFPPVSTSNPKMEATIVRLIRENLSQRAQDKIKKEDKERGQS